jgi:hypothetical protein
MLCMVKLWCVVIASELSSYCVSGGGFYSIIVAMSSHQTAAEYIWIV